MSFIYKNSKRGMWMRKQNQEKKKREQAKNNVPRCRRQHNLEMCDIFYQGCNSHLEYEAKIQEENNAEYERQWKQYILELVEQERKILERDALLAQKQKQEQEQDRMCYYDVALGYHVFM